MRIVPNGYVLNVVVRVSINTQESVRNKHLLHHKQFVYNRIQSVVNEQ